jgi:hypothetical protein
MITRRVVRKKLTEFSEMLTVSIMRAMITNGPEYGGEISHKAVFFILALHLSSHFCTTYS